MECVLSGEVPTCLVPLRTGVAYTALSGLDEETMPACATNFPETRGSCDPESCMSTVITCQEGALVTSEVECLPEDGSKCKTEPPAC